MSLTTIVAFILALGVFIGAVVTATDNFLVFVSLSSFVIVFGGTMAATFVSYEFRYVWLS